MTTYSESGSCCSSDRPGLRQMRTVNGQIDITLNPLNPVFSRVCADFCHIPKQPSVISRQYLVPTDSRR
ncbi:hypothetical protein CXB40_04495 [Pseudomonas syringae pv. avii]|nr:hypothetical protein CXB40_04495 [Pseudomonas syringae pv. avii]RMR24825.1 hypothetical protein ALP89_102586 [Pseudomonas syringae pv. persicae]